MDDMKLNTSKINNLLLEKDWNQSTLAEKVGVSREAVSQWLRGISKPRTNKLLKISRLLNIPFDDLFLSLSEPTVEFRKKGNFKINERREMRASAQASQLQIMADYLPYEKISEFGTFVDPSLDYKFVQEAAEKVRSSLNIVNDRIDWESLFKVFKDSRIVFIPVLWGDNHYKNGLHFHLPESKTNWIFVNLDAPVLDFAFMVCHELGHAKTPSLTGDDAERFADLFAGAILFPWSMAENFYSTLQGIGSSGKQINKIKEEATRLLISPITILEEVNKFAKFSDLPEINLNIFPATTNLNKKLNPLSYYIFNGEEVTVKKYLEASESIFHSFFFEGLKDFICSDRLSGRNEKLNFVASAMDVAIEDANEILSELENGG
jgi:transcriptional regulator with XRE-family HTH domain